MFPQSKRPRPLHLPIHARMKDGDRSVCHLLGYLKKTLLQGLAHSLGRDSRTARKYLIGTADHEALAIPPHAVGYG